MQERRAESYLDLFPTVWAAAVERVAHSPEGKRLVRLASPPSPKRNRWGNKSGSSRAGTKRDTQPSYAVRARAVGRCRCGTGTPPEFAVLGAGARRKSDVAPQARREIGS